MRRELGKKASPLNIKGLQMKISTIAAVAAMGLLAAAQAHSASLVTNGSFETTTAGGGQLGYNTDATGWATSGYNFLFPAGTADTTGVTGVDGGLQLWGPGNGVANGLPASSPDGGNYVAADGAYQVGAITQSINGLTPGAQYDVGFYWAGAQQQSFFGATTEQWVVSLGAQTISTSVLNNASQGFTGWTHEDFTFTATSASETLSFLAVGTPSGVPPFSLLDGVTLNAVVPEPATWAMMILGVGGIGALARRRRAAGLAAATAA
jgi:hypothetical protein